MLFLSVFGVFSLLALLFTGQVWLDYTWADLPISWGQALGISSVDWYLWAAATPAVTWLGRRWPIRPRTWWRAVVIHAPLCLLLMLIKLAIGGRIIALLMGRVRQPAPFLRLYVGLFTYYAILGVAAAIERARTRRARDLRTSQLETELVRTQLDALKMRLHPHFLFNTLNGISALMREDVEAADLMLTRLGDLLRLTLDRAGAQEVPLKEELDVVGKYIEIQQVRFGDRLTIRVDTAPGTLALAVPSLMLQPLVENAFEHGAGAMPGPATIVIRSARSGTSLVIEVTDDGPGPPVVVQHGYGLDTTRARLQHLYGGGASLVLERVSSGGAVARLSLPARAMPDQPSASS